MVPLSEGAGKRGDYARVRVKTAFTATVKLFNSLAVPPLLSEGK